MVKTEKPKELKTLSDALELVAFVTGIRKDEILSQRQFRPNVFGRHLVNYVVYYYLDETLFVCRDFFNKKAHATIINSLRRIEEYRSDKELKAVIQAVDAYARYFTRREARNSRSKTAGNGKIKPQEG